MGRKPPRKAMGRTLDQGDEHNTWSCCTSPRELDSDGWGPLSVPFKDGSMYLGWRSHMRKVDTPSFLLTEL